MAIAHEPKEDASEVQWYRDPVVSTADHQLGKSKTLEFAPCSLQSQLTRDTGLGPQRSYIIFTGGTGAAGRGRLHNDLLHV